MSDKPNILIITTDQQRWDCLSYFGTPGYHTPNLDKLAAEGVLFQRSYTPSPICTPARVSMITGLYPTRHGAFSIGMEPVPALEDPCLAHHVKDAGYQTAIIGKTHFVARHLEHKHVAGMKDIDSDANRQMIERGGFANDPPEEFWDTFDGPYVGFDFVRHCSSHTSDRAPNAHYRSWLNQKNVNLDEQHNHFDENGDAVKIEIGKWDKKPELTQTAWICEEATNWIGKQSEPWLCMMNLQDPHPPFVCPDPYFSAVDMSDVQLAELKEGEMDDKPPFYKRYIEGIHWSDSEEIKFWDGINVPAMSHDNEKMDKKTAVQAYIGMVNMLDDYLGKVFAALDEMGQRENTLIFFTSDHGEELGEHGLWGKGVSATDGNQRIPGIMSWPKKQNAQGGENPTHFNLVDMCPTILDAAEIDIPVGMQGISLLDAFKGECVRDWALVDNQPTINFHQQSLIYKEHKIVCYRHADYGELYDLEQDPMQYKNLFDDPAAAEIKQEMLIKLIRVNMDCAGKQPLRIAHA
ncbi:MAG: sulfatase-like hydrolase/transferase [Planctomycetes bacterium]|nr:sulfatase-like hydrolase/transferase [Planctomycetota bacterium]